MRWAGVEEQEEYTRVGYYLTYRAGWEKVLCLINQVLDDFISFGGELKDLMVGEMVGAEGKSQLDELKEANYKIFDTKFAYVEKGWMSIKGYSGVLRTNLTFTVYNQLDRCTFDIQDKEFIKERGERVLDRYADSAEINATMEFTKKQIYKDIMGFANPILNQLEKKQRQQVERKLREIQKRENKHKEEDAE